MSNNRSRGNWLGKDPDKWVSRNTNIWDGIWRFRDVDYYHKKSPAPSWAIGIGQTVFFTVEIYAGKGQNFGINYNGSPPANDPARQGGGGGYTKLEMKVPTAYVLDVNTPNVYWSSGSGPGYQGAPSAGISIDGKWMCIVGGGGGAGGSYRVDSTFSPSLIEGTINGAPGGAGSGGYSGNTTGSVGGNASPSPTLYSTNPYFEDLREAGNGGGGAPGGAGGSGAQGGGGGGGSIRIYYETSTTEGYLPPSVNNTVYMKYITHSNGTSTSNRVVITNPTSGNTLEKTSGSVPMFQILNL